MDAFRDTVGNPASGAFGLQKLTTRLSGSQHSGSRAPYHSWMPYELSALNTDLAAIHLATERGSLRGLLHTAVEYRREALLCIGGVGGGVDGPSGIYTELGIELAAKGFETLRLDYRTAELSECVFDTLCGITLLVERDRTSVILIGHSLGGAVAIRAAATSRSVIGVAALASQTLGTEDIKLIAPRPIIILHGLDDRVLPGSCARDLYRRASQPKELVLYPDCDHCFKNCRDDLRRVLLSWINGLSLPKNGAKRRMRGR